MQHKSLNTESRIRVLLLKKKKRKKKRTFNLNAINC